MKSVSDSELKAYLLLLNRGLVLLRMACEAKDMERASALADALHSLPHDLAAGKIVDDFDACYLAPIVQRYPDLAQLRQYLPK